MIYNCLNEVTDDELNGKWYRELLGGGGLKIEDAHIGSSADWLIGWLAGWLFPFCFL